MKGDGIQKMNLKLRVPSLFLKEMHCISGCVCVDPASDLSPVKDEIVTRRAETITIGTVFNGLR